MENILFPGYIFLQVHNLYNTLISQLKRIRYFIRMLPNNTKPSPLSTEDKDLLLYLISFGDVIKESHAYFNENKQIIIKSGPLKGLLGKIIKVDRRKNRAKVQLDIINNTFIFDFSYEILEPPINQ